MNTAAQRLTPLTLIAATLAAMFLFHDAKASTEVVRLEPVHVTAQRVPAGGVLVVQLPRVEVTAKRADTRALQVVRLGHESSPQVFPPLAERKNGVL